MITSCARNIPAALASVLLLLPLVSHSAVVSHTIFCDEFNGTIVSSGSWRIPTWVSSTDGTFIWRTQFRVSQNSPLPAVINGNAQVTLETYNPTGDLFYGTDLIANPLFTLGEGLSIIVRAKMNGPVPPGIVGGIFLYALKPGSNTLHDEIDFELLSNRPNQVQTNIYANEPLGAGHPTFVTYASGTISDYHVYEIRWLPNQVTWYVDGRLVRTATANLPTGPMYLHLNIWAPGEGWAEAYSADLQPTNNPANNKVFAMSVDSVTVQSLSTQRVTTISLAPASLSMAIGTTAQLTATPRDQFGNPMTALLTWTSGNPAVARVSSTGLVTGLASGGTAVWAASGGVLSNVSNVAVTANPGIALTSVPLFGAPSGYAQGTVSGVTPSMYQVGVYIKVGGRWYNKPTLAAPSTTILSSGTWSANIVTSPSDAYATEIRAYLLPRTVSVPIALGTSTLPSSLASYRYAVRTRSGPLASISLTPTSFPLPPGKSLQLTATSKDQYGNPVSGVTLTWTSSNTAVAKVSSTGLVTAVANGTAIIRAAGGGFTSNASTVYVSSTPSITLTSVPPPGATSGSAKGTVAGVLTTEYHVAVYIKVANLWYTKPTLAAPATVINPNGTWGANVVTSASDANATEIRAYLLPRTVAVPTAFGTSTLPTSLGSYRYARVVR